MRDLDPALITSRTICLRDLFTLGRFHPASVQREFQWDEDNCRLLLEDLERVFVHGWAQETAVAASQRTTVGTGEGAPERSSTVAQAAVNTATPSDPDAAAAALASPPQADIFEPVTSAYYLGSIVVQMSESGPILLYDGLQRMTTLTILLAILRDRIDAPDLCKGLHQLIAMPGRASANPFRLNLRLGHALLRDEVQLPGEAIRNRRPRSGLTPADERIRRATRYMNETVRKWPQDARQAFARWLPDHAAVTLVEVSEPKVARQVFVSTNLHGKPLSPVDLLKGQLMDLAQTEQQADGISRKWQTIQARISGDVEAFFVALDFLVRREPQGSDCLTQLAAHIEQNTRPGAVVYWFNYLDRMSQAWAELEDRLAMHDGTHAGVEIWKLGFFRWAEWKPLALVWMRQYLSARHVDGTVHPVSEEAFVRRFRALNRRCMAISLAGYSPADRATIFGRALKQTDNRQNPLTRALNFQTQARTKMLRTLSGPLLEPELRRTLLIWLEASLWSDGMCPGYVAQATVEHVLPQNPAAKSAWLKDFIDEDKRFDSIHSLGNLAALDRDRQTPAHNLDFAQKRKVFAGKPEFQTLNQVMKSRTWTRAQIRQRERRLVETVFRLMELPDLNAS